MTAEDENIERIVREVMQRLAAATTAKSETNGKQQEKQSSREELTVSTRLVTVRDLPELAGVKRLIVPPRAVITPAARDLLRQQRIDVAYAVRPSGSKRRLAIGSTDAGRDVATVVQRLASDGNEIQRLANAGLGAMADEMADLVVKSGYFGMLWTDKTAAAVCLANRHRGVRAVTGNEAAALREAIQSVGANVIVIRPGSLNGFQLRRQIGEICASTQNHCPAEYEKWLK